VTERIRRLRIGVVTATEKLKTRRALTIALVLIGLGVLGTFPTFFQVFAPAE
jgi:hypothetical protein